MPASRLIAWHPPHLKPLFFTIALLEYCEKFNYDELYLVECPDEVYRYLKELKPDSCISFSQRAAKRKRYKLKTFFGQLTNLKKLMILALSCLRTSKNLSTNDKAKLVVYSHALGTQTMKNKGDHFFGRMFDEISGIDRKDILWLYFTEKMVTLVLHGL